MTVRDANRNFMNGVPELLILRLLRDEEMYGYEIVQAIRARTADAIAVGEGVVYPVLHGLESAGVLSARRRTVNKRSRIYYSLTPAGQHRLTCLADTWNQLAGAIERLFKGATHAEGLP